MTKQEYRHNARIVLELTVCALTGRKPEAALTETVSREALFQTAQSHLLTALTAYALESAGIFDAAFTEAKEKSVRKNILLDTERAKVIRQLEEHAIWYMPLKGALLKDWYPKLGMRQMTDNDILCDGEKMAEIRGIFTQLGYTCKSFGSGCRDEYIKEPVMSFEMHKSLFGKLHIGNLFGYYENVKARLLPQDGTAFGFRFSPEDFYIYMLAHAYKHYTGSGIGLRTLTDTYVFLRKFGDSLDRRYLQRELQTLGIAEFEALNRSLTEKIFAGQILNAEEETMLDIYACSGAFGTASQQMENRVKRYGGGSKLRYLLTRILPPRKFMEESVPWVKKSVLLLPAAWIYRIFRGMFVNGRKNLRELRMLK